MRILVTCKRVPDPDQRIRVLPDGSDIAREELSFVINPFDAIALEEALRIRESGTSDVEVVAVGIGSDEYEQELRTALAMGADRGLLVECDQPLDPWNVSALLQELVRREAPRLVLMGKQAVDNDANQTGQFLAARLNWPQATFASRIELGTDEACVQRETDTGIETVRVPLPAVITADLRLNEPRYASLPSIMKARRKTIEKLPYQQLDVTLEPRVEILKLESSSSRRSCVTVHDVNELIDRLRDEVKVL